MRKLVTLIIFLFAMTVQGTVLGKHLNQNLRQENIPVEQAPQYFGKWIKIDSMVTFTLVKDETDDLGFRHQRYAQQYNGITVDAACLMVHSKDGKLTVVNGYVMETDAAPARQVPSRVRGARGKDLVLVETPGGFVFAVKSVDAKTHDIIYTDAETGQVVKRLPTTFHLDGQTKAKGMSYYYGEKEIDVTKLADGRIIMADSVRKIYTYDAASAPDTIPAKYKNAVEEEDDGSKSYYPDSAHCKLYFDEVLKVAQTRRDVFKMQELTQLTLDLTAEGRRAIASADDAIAITVTCGDVTLRDIVKVGSFPLVIHPEQKNTISNNQNYMRMNDTDTTYVAMRAEGGTLIDLLEIAPTADGGDVASMKVAGEKGMLAAEATLKACGNYVVDVHWGMQRVYDFYKSVLNRDSYDNCGSHIINVVNPRHVDGSINSMISMKESNAYASSYSLPRLVYGRGCLKEKSDEQVELSTMGHEYTHLVTRKTADLESTGEAGGLNEAISDIFGAAIVDAVLNADGSRSLDYVYAIGQDSERQQPGACLRSMKNPWIKQDPKAVEGKFWGNPADLSSDQGGIHSNCCVLDFWFYLLSEGFHPDRDTLDASVVDPDFIASVKTSGWKGIGISKAIKIVYRLQTQYLYEKAGYRAAYNLSKQAAIDLGYDENSEEYQTMMKCWHAVTPAGWTEAVSLADAVTFSFTAKTVKEFVDNNSVLADYNGTQLKSGIVELTGTFTLNDPAKLRNAIASVPKYLPATCTIITLSSDEATYDFTKAFKEFVGKVLADNSLTKGYSQSYTLTDTVRGGCTAEILTSIQALETNRTESVDINENATTYLYKTKTQLTTADEQITVYVQMNSGYPMMQKPNEADEKVYFTLYRLDGNGQETQINQFEIKIYFSDIKSYTKSKSKYFSALFGYVYPANSASTLADAKAEPLPVGDYRVKVSSTWEALRPNQFDITVVSTTGIEERRRSTVDESAGDAFWYTIDGRRLTEQGLKKGIYIHGGKKVILK